MTHTGQWRRGIKNTTDPIEKTQMPRKNHWENIFSLLFFLTYYYVFWNVWGFFLDFFERRKQFFTVDRSTVQLLPRQMTNESILKRSNGIINCIVMEVHSPKAWNMQVEQDVFDLDEINIQGSACIDFVQSPSFKSGIWVFYYSRKVEVFLVCRRGVTMYLLTWYDVHTASYTTNLLYTWKANRNCLNHCQNFEVLKNIVMHDSSDQIIAS